MLRLTRTAYEYALLLAAVSSDPAIDLGTANTLVYTKDKGIVINEPSIVALNGHTGDVEAVGTEAKDMLGRTPNDIVAIKPLRDGVIADFEVTERMLNAFIRKAHRRNRLVHPRIVIGVPSETTRKSRSGRSSILPTAPKRAKCFWLSKRWWRRSAPGSPSANRTRKHDCGYRRGTTDIAVLSLSGVVYSRSLRVAGNQMDDAIIRHMKRQHNLLIGERTAESVKIGIGSAHPSQSLKL